MRKSFQRVGGALRGVGEGELPEGGRSLEGGGDGFFGRRETLFHGD